MDSGERGKRIEEIVELLRQDPSNHEALTEYQELREEAVRETVHEAILAMEGNEPYALMLPISLPTKVLQSLFAPSNPLLPDLTARVIAEDVRDIAFGNLQEMIKVGGGANA